jgi:hypothetical protein
MGSGHLCNSMKWQRNVGQITVEHIHLFHSLKRMHLRHFI